MSIEPKHRANLEQIAEYLERLPSDYAHFSMRYFNTMRTADAIRYGRENGGLEKYGSCGTVACVVGHGPAAGILVPESCINIDYSGTYAVDWLIYMEEMFGHDAYNWCFSDGWASFDDTFRGAAARIRYYLANDGVTPEGFEGCYHQYVRSLMELYRPYLLEDGVTGAA